MHLGIRWLGFLGGCWLILAPVIFGYQVPAAIVNDVAVGVLVAIVALYSSATPFPRLHYVQSILGLWLMYSPFVLHYGTPNLASGTIVNEMVFGLCLFLNGLLPSEVLEEEAPGSDRVPHAV